MMTIKDTMESTAMTKNTIIMKDIRRKEAKRVAMKKDINRKVAVINTETNPPMSINDSSYCSPVTVDIILRLSIFLEPVLCM